MWHDDRDYDSLTDEGPSETTSSLTFLGHLGPIFTRKILSVGLTTPAVLFPQIDPICPKLVREFWEVIVSRTLRVSVKNGSFLAFTEDPGLSIFFNFLMSYGNPMRIGCFLSILHVRHLGYADDFTVPTAMCHLYHHDPRC